MNTKISLSMIACAALAIAACNGGGGGGSSSTISSNGYAGQPTQGYSESLPSGGTLNSITNMIYPAESANGTATLNFQVESISGSVTVNFTPAQTSSLISSTGVKAAGGTGLPSISPGFCTFNQNNESCSITLNLNGASAGTYAVTPSESSTSLTPISFTAMNVVAGTFTYSNGTYSITGMAWDGEPDCLLSPLPAGARLTLNGNTSCITTTQNPTPVCQPVESSALINIPVQLPYSNTFCAETVGNTCTMTGVATAVGLTSNGGLYITNTYNQMCISTVGSFYITKISN